MNAYRRLPRWAQWTIPILLVLLVVGAAASGSKKNASVTAARPTHTTQTQPASHKTTTSLGWPTSKEPTLTTHAQVVAAGDAICSSMNRRIKPLLARLNGLKEEAQAPIQQEAPPLLTKIGKDLFNASIDLQDLPLTASEKPPVERLSEAVGATGSSYNEESAALQTGDAETIKTDEREVPRTWAMAVRFAQKYGFHVCGAEP
ncbi:MAG TPA: hypothetical protein VID29_11025 [Solirubrobacteraceae bacterium]